MYFKGEDFKYFFNGESKTKKELEQLIDCNTTVNIKGLDVFYSSPKKVKKTDEKLKIEELRNHILNNNTIDKDFVDILQLIIVDSEEKLIVLLDELRNSNKSEDVVIEKEAVCKNNIREILKEADEYQKQNGGILKGVEFPFDLYNKSEYEQLEDYIREQNIISDWERKEENVSPFTFNFDDIKLPKKEVGKKETEGKLNYELDWEFIQQMAERMSQNKDKYNPYNWQLDMNVESLKQSLFRHVIEIMKGNYSDNNRMYGHLESIALNALFINYQLKNNKLGYVK